MAQDDEGFLGYVPTSEDPGVIIIVATCVFVVLSNSLLPCFVAFGRSYEKRRLALQQSREEATPDMVTSEIPSEPVRAYPIDDENYPPPVSDDGGGVSSRSSSSHRYMAPGRPKNYEKKLVAFQQAKEEQTIDTSPSKTSHAPERAHQSDEPFQPRPVSDGGVVSSRSSSSRQYLAETQLQRPQNRIHHIFDKMVIPPYPDENDATIFTRHIHPKAISAISDAEQNHDSNNSEVLSMDETWETASMTMLDTPRKRSRGHARQRRAMGDPVRWREDVEREANLDKEDLGESFADRLMSKVMPRPASQGEINTAPTDLRSSEDASRGHMRYRNVLPYSSSWKPEQTPQPSVMSELQDYAVSPTDAADANDPGRSPLVAIAGSEEVDLCCGKHAWWRPMMILRGLDTIITYAEWDREMARIVTLSIPLSMGGFFEGLFDILTVAIIGQYIGTDSIAAFTIVDLLLGLPLEFFGGFEAAIGCLCPQAYGADNNRLAGQYVQIGALLFMFCMIPTSVVGVIFTEDIMRLLGFEKPARIIAREYAPYFMATEIVDGMGECYDELLTVINHEQFVTLVNIGEDALRFSVVLAAVLTSDGVTLRDVGIIHLIITSFFALSSIGFTIWKGWMEPFYGGMFQNWALRNWKAVRNVCRTAAPISFGFLLQYGEWEILTVFAAHLGPAEVATWGILGTLWESFEAITEGIADGGEIRVGYHLGANRPKRAMRAAYKAVIFGMFIGCIFTSVIFMLGDNLAVWFTTDPALQHMIADLLPLLGIGNIALTAGIVAWGLVGAQGRYRLATTIAFVSSWLVTMPLAAIFTYVLNFDLKGMTTAVVVGYSLTNTTLLYVLILSDWDRLSKIIIRMHLEAAEQNESSSSSRSCNAHEVDVGEEPSTESPDRSTSNQTYNC